MPTRRVSSCSLDGLLWFSLSPQIEGAEVHTEDEEVMVVVLGPAISYPYIKFSAQIAPNCKTQNSMSVCTAQRTGIPNLGALTEATIFFGFFSLEYIDLHYILRAATRFILHHSVRHSLLYSPPIVPCAHAYSTAAVRSHLYCKNAALSNGTTPCISCCSNTYVALFSVSVHFRFSRLVVNTSTSDCIMFLTPIDR